MALQRYVAARSAAEAVALLASSDAGSPLSGGTDLLVQMRNGMRSPQTVVDLKHVPGMIGVEFGTDSVRIGAATPCASLTANARLRALFPGLVEGAGLIGSKQVQGRASIGGNLCNASPAADSVPGMIANRGRILIEGPQGARTVAAEAFCTGVGRNCLGQGEFVHAIELPLPAARSADAYLRFIPRSEMDIAVVGAAVALTLDAAGRVSTARVVIGAVAPTALLVEAAGAALIGSALDEQALAAAADAARAASSPITDRRGSADFRRHVVGVLVRRAVTIAAQRASATA